jgi:membrane protease YdiL (CAAX protease family)
MTNKKPKTQNEVVDQKSSSIVTWGPAASIIVVVVIYIVSQLIAALILSIYPALKHWSYSQAQNWLSNSNYASFILTLIVETLVIFFLWLFLKHRKTTFKSIGLKDRPRLTDLGYILVGFAIYFLAYAVCLTLVQRLVPSLNVNIKQDIGFSTSTVGNQLWLVFISLVILPPIAEEILFRGFMYTGLRTKLNKIVAALIVSVFFASLHLIEGQGGVLWVAGLDTFILSLVLIYLREKTDKLWASMGLHMVKNFIAFAALFLFHIG